MYRGKHEKPVRGICKYKKSGILLASLVLILALTIGTTVAFLIDSTNTVENTFLPVEVGTDIQETFVNNSKSSIKFQNTGDVPAYIRAKILMYWTLNENGTESIVPGPPPFNVTINIKEDNGWVEYEGIYYYTKQVPANAYTAELLDEAVTLINIPEGYTFHMQVLGEAIQAEPASAVQDAWNVTIANGSVTAVSSN